jgi:DNA-binding transcriptional LysR family regulator
VRSGTADVAITFSYPGDRVDPHGESARGLTVESLWADEMLLALPAAHPAARHRRVPMNELADEVWIAGCPRCRGHLLQVAGVSGFAPTIAYETDNFSAVLALVAEGIGIALVPALAVDATRVPQQVALRSTGRRDARTLHLVTTDAASRIPAVAATLETVRSLDIAGLSLAAETSADAPQAVSPSL